MTSSNGASPWGKWTGRLMDLAPGLPALLGYRHANFTHDLLAGLSVAAVALPVGVAYAQLAAITYTPLQGDKFTRSPVGRAQDVPDMHRCKLGKRWATRRFCPIYHYYGPNDGRGRRSLDCASQAPLHPGYAG